MKLILVIVLSVFLVEGAVGWSLNPLKWFSSSKGCQLNLNSDLNKAHEPLFLTKTRSGFELAMPQLVEEEGVFKLSKGDKLYVACPGNKNEIRGFEIAGSESVMSKCVRERTLELKGREVTSSELECKNKVFSTLKLTKKDCGNFGEEIQLGFEVEGWHPLVTVCYARARATTLHASHLLYGSTLRGAQVRGHQSYFLKGPHSLYADVDPAAAYKQANQRETLTRILGETKANYFLARSYLARGHLSPDGDFLLGAWQHLTYFYVNTAPQWQSINGGNWLRLETMVRSFSSSMQKDFVVTTGTYGVLELVDSKGRSRQIFLEPVQQQMPVPLLFWKIVADPNSSSCVVFLVHNNPFLDKAPSTICSNVCEEHGWRTDLDSVFKGFMYCCSYADFKRVVDYAPDFNCRSVLSNTSK